MPLLAGGVPGRWVCCPGFFAPVLLPVLVPLFFGGCDIYPILDSVILPAHPRPAVLQASALCNTLAQARQPGGGIAEGIKLHYQGPLYTMSALTGR